MDGFKKALTKVVKDEQGTEKGTKSKVLKVSNEKRVVTKYIQPFSK